MIKKSKILCTTLAGAAIVAGLTIPKVKAVEGTKAIVSEEKDYALVQLDSTRTILNRGALKELIEGRYKNYNLNNVTVSTIDGEAVSESNSSLPVGTGKEIVLSNGEKLTLVIYGDVNSDGKADLSDSTDILYHYAKVNPITDPAKLMAGDITGTTTDVDLSDSTKALFFYADQEGIVDEDKILPETINIHTISFKNTLDHTTTEEITAVGGKLAESQVKTDLTDPTGKKRFVGWAEKETDKKADVVEGISEKVFEADKTYYSVWLPNTKVIVNACYDGTPEGGGTKVEKVEGYYVGDIIDLANDEAITSLPEATHPAAETGVTYRQTGWYVESPAEGSLVDNKYTIPVPEESDEETEAVEINIHPTWDIAVSSVETVNSTTLNKILNELTTLQKDNKANNGDIEIDAKVTLESEITKETIPEGVTLTFNDEVTVRDNAYIDPEAENIINKSTVTKEVKNNHASNATKGLNDSLNNPIYDVVKLGDDIGRQQGVEFSVEITDESSAKLDLNGNELKLKNTFSFTNNGELTIVNNSSAKEGKISTQQFTNNGNLIIGETPVAGSEVKNVEIKNYTTSPKEVITNAEGATLTIKSGKILNVSNSDTKATGAVVKNEEGGTLYVEGGTLEAKGTSGRMPTVLNEGDAEISDGTFIRSANSDTHGQGYYVIVNHSHMTINGGTFEEKNSSNLSATSALIENGYQTSFEAVNKEATLDILGGTFNGGRYVVASDYAGKTNVYKGKFTAKKADKDYDKNLTGENETRAIFKVVGEMTLDFSEATTGENGNSLINLGDTGSKTKLVLIGDQNLTAEQSVTTIGSLNKLNVYPFKNELVKFNTSAITDENINDLIVVEKGKGQDNKKVSSAVEIHVGGDDIDPINAGKELMALLGNAIASKDNKDTLLNKERNTVLIKLEGNVTVESEDPAATKDIYDLTTEDSELDLNGKTLTINALCNFKKDIKVSDSVGTGKIILNSEKAKEYNLDGVIFEHGEFTLTDQQLAEIADSEAGAQ